MRSNDPFDEVNEGSVEVRDVVDYAEKDGETFNYGESGVSAPVPSKGSQPQRHRGHREDQKMKGDCAV
jgi:hypothetical protein